ncbi:MAG: hypothetical protein NVSMB28_16470 [Collimonas sp.]
MQRGCGLNQKPPLYSAAPPAAPQTDDKITLQSLEKCMMAGKAQALSANYCI